METRHEENKPNNFNKSSELIEQCMRLDRDRLDMLCRMHLSFILDFSCDEWAYVPSDDHQVWHSHGLASSLKRRQRFAATVFGVFRNKADIQSSGRVALEEVCLDGVYDLIRFLGQDANVHQEGLFRKSGNKSRQHELYLALFEGHPLHLANDGLCSVHDCANVLKCFLANLSEPLLTEAHYAAHCQIAEMWKTTLSVDDQTAALARQIQSLQLIFMLLPHENRKLLQQLLNLLHCVALDHTGNKMNASNLATMFAPHLLCPRKMTAEELRVKSSSMSKAVAFMIENAPQLFQLPSVVVKDLENFISQNDRFKKDGDDMEPVHTTVTFCERHCQNGDTTAVALAELFAYVQSLPESAKKKQLVRQFNKENIKGNSGMDVSKNGQHRKSLMESVKRHVLRTDKQQSTSNAIFFVMPELVGGTQLKGNNAKQLNEKMEFDKLADGQRVTATVETIRHPAYYRTNAISVIDRTISKCDTRHEKKFSGSKAVQPSASSPGFDPRSVGTSDMCLLQSSGFRHRQHPVTKYHISCACHRHTVVYRETAL